MLLRCIAVLRRTASRLAIRILCRGNLNGDSLRTVVSFLVDHATLELYHRITWHSHYRESRVCSREHVESNVLRSTSATSDLIITLSIKCRRDISKNSLLPIHFPRKFEERLENSALEDIAGPCSSMSHSAFLEEGFLALRYCPQTRQSPICST